MKPGFKNDPGHTNIGNAAEEENDPHLFSVFILIE
jgi:hypothetical protein